MFRFINISVFALAIAGVASAGAIDPTVTSNYSSSSGVVYSSNVPVFSYGTSVTPVSGHPPAYSTSNAFYGATANGDSSPYATGGPGLGSCPYSNLFGGNTTCEGTNDFIYAESGTNGSVYTLDFTLTASETIYGFSIYLEDDSNSSASDPNRGVTNVSFYDGTPILANRITDDTDGTGMSYTQQFGSNEIQLTDEFSTGVTGQEFSFTFAAATDSPRILEVVALDSPVPEPGTWMLAGLGILGLATATKMRNRRLQSKL